MFLAVLLVMVSASPFLVASAFSPPNTTVSIHTTYTGTLSDGGNVYTGPSPQFSFAVNAANNTTLGSTEYKFGQNGNVITYNGTFTYWGNHSHSFTLFYRSNSSGGLENWKSLDVNLDATLPVLNYSALSSPVQYSKVNQSNVLISNSRPVHVSCSDAGSGVQGVSIIVENTTRNFSSSTVNLTHSLYRNATNNTTASATLECTDNVGLVTTTNITLEEDVTPPVLSLTESGLRNGACVEAAWRLFASSQDNQSNSTVQYLDQSTWRSFASPTSFQTGFSSTVQLRALDSMGLASLPSNLSITVDDSGPQISSSLTNSSLHLNVTDPCGVGSTFIQWQSSTGLTTAWTYASTNMISVPSSLNGSLVRATINSTDSVGNSNISTTPWQHTFQSLPGANLLLLSAAANGFSSPQFRLALSPTGHQSNVTWILTKNNLSVSNGTTSSTQNIAHNFSHGDTIRLDLSISGSLGQTRNETHTWVVDGQNNISTSIVVSGSSINITGLVLGANSRLVHGQATDDQGGVGGDFVECTDNGSIWWRSPGGFYLPQTLNSGSSSFVYGCRSVDLLGNRGPSVWSNGSFDLSGPQASLQPVSATTIGPSTPIVITATDSSGVSGFTASFRWQNSTGSQHLNLSQGGGSMSVRMSQLFTTSGDGVLSLNLSSTDVLGNVNHQNNFQWSVNASNPFLSLSIFNGSGTFIPFNSTELQIFPPPNWGSNLSFNYSLSTSTTTLFSGSSSGTVILKPQFSSDGFVWLNTTSTDALGRSVSQSWRLDVDGTVNTQPVYRLINQNVTVGGKLLLGPFSTIQITNAVDDPGGSGSGRALCSLDNSSFFPVSNNGLISPSGSNGVVEDHILRCKNQDALGNTGSEVWLNFSLDLQPPSHSIQPTTAFISPNQTISVLSADNQSQTSSTLQLQWSNSTSTINRSVSISASPYNFTIQNLFGVVGDGLITASLQTSDEVGNIAVANQYSWFLSTQQPQPQLELTGNIIDAMLGTGNITVALSAIVGGSGTYTGQYNITHSNGTVLRQGNFTSQAYISISNLSQGQIQIVVAVTDVFGRTQQRQQFFDVDDSIATHPGFIISGPNHSQYSTLWFGPTTSVSLTNLTDDANGVGFLRTECRWNGGDWFTYSPGGSITISSQNNVESNQTLGCRNVDRLLNVGPIANLNFTMDTVRPNVTFSPTGISTVAPSTLIQVSATDTVGIASSQLKFTWSNGGQSWNTTRTFYGSSWNTTLNNIASNLTDGTVSIDLFVLDRVGNQQSITGISWQLNTTEPLADVQLNGNHVGSYIGAGNISFSILPSGVQSNIQYNLESNSNWSFFNGTTNTTTTIAVNNLTEGRVWLNTTITDGFSRTQQQTFVYDIDQSVGTTPVLSLQGTYQQQNGSVVLGKTGGYQIQISSDDAWGVGHQHVSCSWNGGSWFTASNSGLFSPPTATDALTGFSLRCRNVDLLGNQGPSAWWNGTVDTQLPQVTFSTLVGTPLSANTQLNMSCSDSSGCNLLSIEAVFSVGTQQTNFTQNLSSNLTSIVLSQLMNVTTQGTVQFTLVAKDNLNNTRTTMTSTYLYLHHTPTVSIQVLSKIHGPYISENLTLSLAPSSGWSSGLQLNMSVEYANNGTTIRQASILSANSTQNFSSIEEGNIWVNTSLCNSVGNCSTSATLLIVDVSAPQAPTLSLTGGSILSNGSLVAGSSVLFNISNGNEWGSGIANTNCSAGDVWKETYSSGSKYPIGTLLSSNQWTTVTCVSTDHVGNTGPSQAYVVYRDDIRPQINSIDLPSDMVLTPGNSFNITCEDLFSVSMNAVFSYQGQTIAQFNASSQYSVLAEDLLGSTPYGSVQYLLSCEDSSGNENTSSQNFEWLPFLTPSTLNLPSVTNENISYVSNSTVLSAENVRGDIVHSLRIVTSSSYSDWVSLPTTLTLNELNFTIVDQSSLRVQLRVTRSGSNLSNLTTSPLLVVDNLGPEIGTPTYTWYGNSTTIPVTVNETGAGFQNVVWSFDNGTNQTSTSLLDLRMPDGTGQSVWFTVTALDRLGNLGQSQSMQLYRDLDSPSHQLLQSHPGYMGLNTSYSILINASTGLKSSTIFLQTNNNQTYVLANNTSNYSFLSSQLPSWLFLNNQLTLVIRATENSQLAMSSEIVLDVDTVQPTIDIDFTNSLNISGLNTSNVSLIRFNIPTDSQSLCYKIGPNTSSMTASCQALSSTTLGVSRTSGNYVLYLKATDQAGNTGERWFNIAHHTEPPQISLNLPSIVRPTQNFTISSTSLFSPQFELIWNNQSLAHSQGLFLIPHTLGNQTLVVNTSDSLGLWSLTSFTTMVDGTAPSLSLEGWKYNGTKFGTNTTLWLNASDTQSSVAEILLSATNGNATCNETLYPQSLSYAVNGTFEFLLSDSSCVLLSRIGAQVVLNLSAVDAVGNVRSVQHSIEYHGATAPPSFVTNRVFSQSGLHRIGPASIVDCLSSTGSIAPTVSLSWSGTGGLIQSSQLSVPSSGGVLTCTQNDAFGNTAQSSLNLTYDSTSPILNVSWPNGSHQPYVMASGQPFFIESTDNESPIFSLRYCVASSPCTPNTNTSGTTQFASTSGGQYLVVSTESLVGLMTNQTVYFVVDNQPPSLNISADNHTIMNGTVVYTGLQNSTLLVEAGDDDCFKSGNVSYDSGSIALGNWTQKSVLVPPSSTFLTVTLEDCVGHLTSASYTVQRLTSITPQPSSVLGNYTNSSFLSGSILSIQNQTSLSLSVLHDVEVEIQCSSADVAVSCESTDLWNEFIVNVTAGRSGYLNLTYSDILGNVLTQAYRVEHDATPPLCQLHASAYMNGSKLVVSSTLASEHLCMDNKNEIEEVYWLSQGNQQTWSFSNNVWVAPVPQSTSVELVAVDRLGNTRKTLFSIVFDSDAPSFDFSNLSSISLDEEMAKRQGEFDVHCFDAVGESCSLHVRQTTLAGVLLWEENFTKQGRISLQADAQIQEIRVWISTKDRIGHERTVVYNLLLDDVKPVLEISWKNSNTGVVLSPELYIPADGVIEVAGLSASGVNASTSTFTVVCRDTNQTLTSASLTNIFDLTSLNLSGCRELNVLIQARDHAGNLASYRETLSVDHITPQGRIGFEDGCAWENENNADLTPDCEVYVEIVDDEISVLRGQYTIVIVNETGAIVNTTEVSINTTLSLQTYVGQSLSLLLTGTDEVGNTVQWDAIQLHVRRNIVPFWVGLRCLESSSCDFGMNLTATSVADTIGLGVQSHHAPLVDITWNFTNPYQENVTFFTPTFESSELSDDVWAISIDVEDAAGRKTTLSIDQFIYDTTAPELIIGVETNGYYEANRSVLGCNTCRLSYRFDDLTGMEITSNVREGEDDAPPDDPFTIIELSGLLQTSINVSAIDAFQRQTWFNVSLLPLETTNINPNQYFSDEKVNVFCREDTPSTTHREVVCLWRRTTPGAVRVPLSFDVILDTNHSRTSQLALTLDGIDRVSMPLRDGGMVYYVEAYTNLVQVEVVDNFSNVKPLNIILLEHDVPWSGIEFVASDISEMDDTTDIILQLSPPQEHEEFHLLYSSEQQGVSFGCSVEYVFISLDRQKPVRTTNDACTVTGVFEKGNKDIELTLSIDHQDVRAVAGLYNHTYDLTNLNSLSILLQYADALGLKEDLNRNDLQILRDEISRANDALPSYVGGCLLDYNGATRSSDGFLQSDLTMPLHRCEPTLSDDDGVHSTVWNMTFFNNQGEAVYTVDLQCSETFFPADWSFGDAFNSGQCIDPGAPFPSGTFDVRIRPFIRDYTMFNKEGGLDQEAYPIIGNETQCEGVSGTCFVEIFVASVTVYPSFDPAVEVRNAQEFIESYSQNPGAGIVLLNLSFIGILVYFWRRSRPKLD